MNLGIWPMAPREKDVELTVRIDLDKTNNADKIFKIVTVAKTKICKYSLIKLN